MNSRRIYLDAARSILEPDGASAELCDVYQTLARLSAFQVDAPGIVFWGEQAVAAARQTGSVRLAIAAESILGSGWRQTDGSGKAVR